jgi:SAM-dependent methyltransferase
LTRVATALLHGRIEEVLRAVTTEALLREISDYCRRVGMAESTFGRLAVNDGKLVSRLRTGASVTIYTMERVRNFIGQPVNPAGRRIKARAAASHADPIITSAKTGNGPSAPSDRDVEKNFRFYDNRQKYLSFVNTCSEKWVVAQRVGLELDSIHPRPPAVRVFDAGIGDGTVLTRLMRAMHSRFPTMPFYIVGKEISLEDVRLALQKMPDRFFEHPASVLVLTNMFYSEAPWLAPNSVNAAASLVWHEVGLTGSTAHEFEEQITGLEAFLSANWRAKVSAISGNPMYEKPVVLVLYREDYKFLLDQVRPRRGAVRADYDLVIASQPYRARASTEFKAKKVIAPLARALGPGGRLIAIHSHGDDPALEIVQKVWPGENPFITDRHALLRATKDELGPAGRDLNFNAYADNRSLFKYEMHTLPNEIAASIGTSTLFAAWNAAIYVAQIEDQRLEEAMKSNAYLDATKEVLHRHGGLWFWDESFVISRKRDQA